MATSPLTVTVPVGPLVDSGGNVTPSWRAFFTALLQRTGGAAGLVTPDVTTLNGAISAEAAAREAADLALTQAVAAETQRAVGAEASKYNVAGGTIRGPVGFYGHGPQAQPVVVGGKAGNAALASLLAGLAGLGLVNDTST